MPFDYEKWFAETIGSGDISEDDAKVLKETLAGDEKVQKALEDSVSRQSDYSRNMDELKTAQTELAESVKKVETEWDDARLYVKRNEDNDHNNEGIYNKLVEENAQFRAKLLESDIEVPKEPIVSPQKDEDVSKYVTVKQLEEMADQRDRAYSTYSTTVMNLSNRHHADFGKYLDTGKLIEFAEAHELNLENAYTEMNKDGYAELAEKSYQERLATDVAKAKEEMIAENPNSPLLDTGPRRIHATEDKTDHLGTPEDRSTAAMKKLQEYRSGESQIPEWTRNN